MKCEGCFYLREARSGKKWCWLQLKFQEEIESCPLEEVRES